MSDPLGSLVAAFRVFPGKHSVRLPEDAAEEQLRAEFKDGVLLVHLPKTEKAKA